MCAQTEFSFINTIIIKEKKRLQLPEEVLRVHLSVALEQKVANFEVTIVSREMQRSLLTGKKQRMNLFHAFKNSLARTELQNKNKKNNDNNNQQQQQ